jgi:hypothetical protein
LFSGCSFSLLWCLRWHFCLTGISRGQFKRIGCRKDQPLSPQHSWVGLCCHHRFACDPCTASGFQVEVPTLGQTMTLNPLLLATTVYTEFSFLSRWPVSPEPERSSMPRCRLRFANPEGWKKLAGGRSGAKTPGSRFGVSRILEGCQTRSATPPGVDGIWTRTPWCRCARPRLLFGKPLACFPKRKTNLSVEPTGAAGHPSRVGPDRIGFRFGGGLSSAPAAHLRVKRQYASAKFHSRICAGLADLCGHFVCVGRQQVSQI